MGRVKEVEYNRLGEAVSAYVFKGSTKELVYRHVTSLILLLSMDGLEDVGETKTTNHINPGSIDESTNQENANNRGRRQPVRKAAQICKRKLKDQANNSL